MRSSQLVSAVALLLCAGPVGIGCGDDEDAKNASVDGFTSGTSSPDATAQSDVSTTTSGTDASPSDSSSPDTASDTRVETVDPGLVAVKDDDTYLVPGNIAEKTEVAAFGTKVAWVEHPRDGSSPFFVVWDVASDAPLAVYTVANLAAPRHLALTRDALVYVDDRYGDPDVFGVALATRATFSVVTQPGRQDYPAILTASGAVTVAWQDCRACVTGDDQHGSEIYTRPLDLVTPSASPAELRLTDDDLPDVHPVFGQTADGVALVWVHARSELVVHDPSGTRPRKTFDVQGELRATDAVGWVATKPGVLAWRTRPVIVNPDSMIVNPDSMYPTDVFVTDVVGVALGTTTQLTRHGELREGYQAQLQVVGQRLGWLDSAPASDRLHVVEGLVPVDDRDVSGLHDVALGVGFVGFIAPRSDNDGLDDLWVLPLPE